MASGTASNRLFTLIPACTNDLVPTTVRFPLSFQSISFTLYFVKFVIFIIVIVIVDFQLCFRVCFDSLRGLEEMKYHPKLFG
jgi:hypothetical protein